MPLRTRDMSAARGSERSRRSASVIAKIGSELKRNPPKILAKTRRKKGVKAANRQRTAILLSKARRV